MKTRIAYIISQYPEFHETFVAREVEALCQKSADLRIFSLKTPGREEQNLYPDHLRFVEYSPFLVSARLIAANCIELARSPRRYFRALLWILNSHASHPMEMFKALAAFPKTVLFAHSMRGHFDAVHAHWATIPSAMAVVVKILTGIGISFTAHAWDIFLSPRQLLREKITQAKGVVTCTEYNVEYLQNVCEENEKDKIHRNYHGLDFASFSKSIVQSEPFSPLRIIAVGRLVEQKGFSYLLRSLEILAKKGVAVQLVIIGEGPLRGALTEESRTIPAPCSVEFAGRLSHRETIERMVSSHVMVAPSVIAGDGDRDGIPNVILEAMACGLSVIGTAVSGIPEVVKDGVTGYLVSSGDPDRLATAIEKIALNRDESKKLGSAGRAFVHRMFDIEKNIEEFIGLLESFHGTGRI
ncbi:MAG: glycosyltransferase family 4 protein [Geobacteraceae bacterium]|nr:glycosyltransferase family 4 protein [Geobacteraceae bacterium]